MTQKNRYQLLFESSMDAIMTLEPPSWYFTSANPAAIKLFGVENEQEFIRLWPWEASPERQENGKLSSEEAQQYIEKAMKKGAAFFEWIHRKKNGKIFFATVLLTRVDMEDRSFLQATVRDITEQKDTKQQLENKISELEKINKFLLDRQAEIAELTNKIEALPKK